MRLAGCTRPVAGRSAALIITRGREAHEAGAAVGLDHDHLGDA
jgi:hypothetical protein